LPQNHHNYQGSFPVSRQFVITDRPILLYVTEDKMKKKSDEKKEKKKKKKESDDDDGED